ncbi:MAG TPA: hypothetical protein VJN88_01980 [Ktedonobacterales bacterium]|nr:hypothetical protein [Ktedonobacterales bacterium]
MGTVAPNQQDGHRGGRPLQASERARDTLRSLRGYMSDQRLNARLRRIVTKLITPVVLLAGLLLLAVVHFHGVLAITTAQTDLYHGVTAYSNGPLQLSFQHNAGTQRPDLIFDNIEVLNYAEWSSTISVDGHVSNLWDNMHGYSQDDAHHQVYSTISGAGWQVIQIATLVDAHTMTVQYDFVARNQGLAAPRDITLSILHTHKSLYQPTLHGATLTAGVLPMAVSSLDGGAAPAPMGALTVAVSGPSAGANPITVNNVTSAVGPNGAARSVADSFTTTYALSNPIVDKVTTLATETITFTSLAAPGAPSGASVATPGS